MKKLIRISTTCILLFASLIGNAQSKKCGTMNNLSNELKKNPSLQTIIENDERINQQWIKEHWVKDHKNTANKPAPYVTIPVVVHVIWHNPVENISDAQIQSQITALNEDFRILNADSLPLNHPFWPIAFDAQIEFCLAKRDPNGNPTNGITRTYTNITSFIGDGTEKSAQTGGKDNWAPTQYLNIWVCNLDDNTGTLGYATFPSSLGLSPNDDGIVIDYEAFGFTGTATPPTNFGRTAVHEVGHWLNLRHIWGDAVCGDDLVSDTEVAEEDNSGCPSFPWNANSICGSGPYGEMYMNFMDYVDDNCMVMFTYGQALRMNATINGNRIGLIYSQGCKAPTNINETWLDNALELYPNPNKGVFTLNNINPNGDNVNAILYDLMGKKLKEVNGITKFPYTLHFDDLPDGIYNLILQTHHSNVSKKLIISK